MYNTTLTVVIIMFKIISFYDTYSMDFRMLSEIKIS